MIDLTSTALKLFPGIFLDRKSANLGTHVDTWTFKGTQTTDLSVVTHRHTPHPENLILFHSHSPHQLSTNQEMESIFWGRDFCFYGKYMSEGISARDTRRGVVGGENWTYQTRP